ncbi:MAG: zinc ABC transporter substrate-binding protein [Mollicutes bacterium]|nr:zinc ABC transporter substrate-binding protein [Mollicutes bacterium]
MKKLIILIISIIFITGCDFIKMDDFDGIDIYTTAYPIEYITTRLYGDYSNIYSIYPDGINIKEYTITNKKTNEFSKAHLFIYNGLSSEKQIAASLINKNKKLNIIDVSRGLEIKNEDAELWISPSNCLMIAQNIKNGLKEYINNTSILEDIDNNYEELKIDISEFDAELKLIAENAGNKTLIVANKAFNFLSKYGFEIINVNDEDSSSTAFARAKKAFSNKENQYLFIISDTDENNENIQTLINNGAKITRINKMDNISDEDRKNDNDYMTFMKDFIEAIKGEVY